ncbi:MAG TPA: efflux RND transporter periplasmic adaptor subunit, partial [Nitrospira sp.]
GDSARILAVPKEAVLEIDGKQFVYLVEEANRYVRQEVKAANFTSDQLRILEGLKPGQRIVTKGAVLIKGQELQGG